MSTKAAILCEDHTNDQFILEPLVEAALRAIGVPRPRVSSITNPRMSGFTTLLANLCDVVSRYHKTVDVVVVAFDLDGEDGQGGRPDKATRVRNALEKCDLSADNVVLLGCVMEAEVYPIWGQRSAIPVPWSEVRSEADPKEAYFDELLRKEDFLASDGGRTRLMKDSLSSGWNSLSSGCPELQQFSADLRGVLER